MNTKGWIFTDAFGNYIVWFFTYSNHPDKKFLYDQFYNHFYWTAQDEQMV